MKTVLTETLSTGLPIPVFVIKAKSITAGNVTVIGTSALAIVADGPIQLNGRLSVDANRDVPGPGSITTQIACRGGTGNAGTNGNPGGGGGGFGSVGGSGGNGGGQAGGSAGAIVGSVELVPLRGGCAGGHHGGGSYDVDPIPTDPGGGGGAIQIVSNTSIVLGPGAVVSANGAGGKGRTGGPLILCSADLPCGVGEGGGSGGAILLEAPRLDLDASSAIVANGGAGGAHTVASAPAGSLTTAPAPGPMGFVDSGGGGNGAAAGGPATNGGNGLNDDPVGGGGGGGLGRIRVNLPSGQQFQPSSIVSPVSSVGVLGTR